MNSSKTPEEERGLLGETSLVESNNEKEVAANQGYTRAQIFEGLRDVLVDALGIDDDEVKPEALIMHDLGAESIDMLDIAFRLEKCFNFKVNRDEIYPHSWGDISLQEKPISTEQLEELKNKMPHADFSFVEENRFPESLYHVHTVQFFMDYIARETQ